MAVDEEAWSSFGGVQVEEVLGGQWSAMEAEVVGRMLWDEAEDPGSLRNKINTNAFLFLHILDTITKSEL